jgi:type III pantothenate kinase
MKFHSFLFVDVGNTLVKWAVPDLTPRKATETPAPPPRPIVKGEMLTSEVTPDRIAALKKSFDGCYLILSSVVPKLTLQFSRTFKRGFHIVTSDSTALGFTFDYPKPEEIGADRLAAAVVVHEAQKWPVIVVSCGTATAFSVIDARGRFCGGAIAPGLQTQLDALLGATAQLPATKLFKPRTALAKSTQEAIRAGVMLNFQGGVNEIIRQLSAALDVRKPQIVLTGGQAEHLVDLLELPHTLRPLLVFEGLRIIGNRVWNATH